MASRSIGTLTLDLLAKTGLFEQGLDKAARDAEKSFKRIERNAKIVGAAIGTALVAGVTAASNALRVSIDRMDELSKAAQRANLPTEQFSALAYAGGLADVQMETLQTTLGRLAKAQADALKSTSQQGKVFEALGIAVQDSEGKLRSSYDVFLDFADAFERQKGSPEIIAAGMQVFGKSFQQIIPLIKDGASGLRDAADEAKDFGYIISTDAGNAAEAFNDNLSRIKSLVGGLAKSVASELLPDLKDLTDEWVNSAREGANFERTAREIADAIRAITAVGSGTIQVIFGIRSALQGVVAQATAFGEISRGILSFDSDQINKGAQAYQNASRGIDAIFESSKRVASSPGINIITGEELLAEDARVVAQMRQQRQEAERLRKLAFGDPEKPARPGRSGGSSGRSEADREAESLQRSYESLMESMKERIALFNTEGETAKVNYDLQYGSLKNLEEPLKENLRLEAERYDQLVKRREEDETRLRLAEEETDRINRALDNGRMVLEDLEFEIKLMGQSNIERQKSIALWGLESEAVERYGEAIGKAIEQRQLIEDQIALADGFRSAFTNAFEDIASGTRSVADVFRDMLKDIAEMITRFAAQKLVEQLFGATGSTQSGSQGGWVQAIASIFAGGRANGGWVGAGQIAEVNERGLEMATVNGRDYMLTGGAPVKVTPNHMLGGGGGSMVNNFNFAAPASPKTQTQVAAKVGFEVRRAQRLGA